MQKNEKAEEKGRIRKDGKRKETHRGRNRWINRSRPRTTEERGKQV